ncbi:MAG: hypothetical protein LBT04_01095 [Prevotellaceae bacterium]|jgi:tetratricopeptide (TPR) repeat protein|nr:hypothetical protein [Prevotellaceae bacterium]
MPAKDVRKIFITLCFAVFLIGCSAKKNTWLSRNYQNFVTRYNVKYNAVTNFDDGLKALIANNKDDYSEILPLYPTVTKETAGAISSQMNTTIEKCRKSIKLHSIRKKPSKKPPGMSDINYHKFREQEEYNRQIPNAWLLLGKAEFYGAEFIGAISDFNYAIRHYPENNVLNYEAKLWKVRSYSEMDWLNEAESELQSIKENAVPYQLTGLYSAFKANLLIKQKRYKEAIPFLELAIKKEKDRYQLSRFEFVLGQLYEADGQKNQASEHFHNAKRKAQNYDMIFNAQLKEYQTITNNSKAIKGLEKMAKSSNNTNYLDQIYYAVGNRYLDANNKPKAIESYKKAMKFSTRNGLEKAIVALKLGDLYYADREYIYAAPFYDSVVKMMPATHREYKRAENLSGILGELVQNYETVHLQDSLLFLSTLSEAEQMKVVEKIIADLIEQEKKAAQDSADRAALSVAMAASSSSPSSSSYQTPGTVRSNEWYFYNTNLVNQGKREFERLWGRRNLEDNWQRTSKISSSSLPSSDDDNDTDTLNIADTVVMDKHNPAHYLAQIPKTDEQKQTALTSIATALYNMGTIFENKLGDDISADTTYKEFQTRFAQDERKVDTYYSVYQINGRLQNQIEQNIFREKIIDEFPASKYALMLSDPNYAEKMAKILVIQDSLYTQTYYAYTKSDFSAVKGNYELMQSEFSLSELMPKFTFLNALSIAKTGTQDNLAVALTDLIEKYPNSDVTPMSRDILALIKQGKENSNVVDTATLVSRRTRQTQSTIDSIMVSVGNFTANVSEPQNIVFVCKIDNINLLNNMLYDVAAYNFNKFLIKNYDFELKRIDRKDLLVISGFENMEEANWYKKLLISDMAFAGKNYINDFMVITVSDSNLQLLGSGRTLDDYLKFSNK